MFAVLVRSNQMSTPMEILEQKYAAEAVKVDADEAFLKRMKYSILVLKGVKQSTG